MHTPFQYQSLVPIRLIDYNVLFLPILILYSSVANPINWADEVDDLGKLVGRLIIEMQEWD